MTGTRGPNAPPPPIVAAIWQHADNRSEQDGVVDERRCLSYGQLRSEIDACALTLRTLGIEAGDPVLVLLDVCAESVVTYWALHAIEAVIVVGDPTGTGADVDHYLEVTGARHVLAGRRAAASIPPPTAAAWHTLSDSTDGALPHWVRGKDPSAAVRPAAMPDHPDDWAVVLFSSGTTSKPKAIVHSRATLRALHEVLMRTWKLSPGDVVLGALPFHTIYGLIFSAASVIYAGATLVLLERFHPERALAAIERHRVTTAAFVPAMVLMILNLEGNDRYDLSSLRALYTASAPISHADVERFRAFSRVSLIANYGMTEIPGAAVEPADEPHLAHGVGKISPGFEVCVRDPDGRPLAVGETGEITMRGPTLMRGYLGDPALTAERVRDGWIHTQDIGRVDADGNIFLSGRTSEMIIRGGLNISPIEVENALARHHAVLDVAVVGTPDAVLGQKVTAFIVARDAGNDDVADGLTQHCRENLSPAKVPAEFIVVDELPRNAGGKVLRKELMKRHAEHTTPLEMRGG